MRPTLLPGDRLFVDRTALREATPEVGSIVVAPDPGPGSRWLVKRVAAVGPATVFVVRDGVMVRSNRASETPPPDAIDRSDLAESEVYLVSDGATGGRDSRTFGPVAVRSLVGLVWWRYFPVDRSGAIRAPAKG
jgi:signal peptidase I